MVRYGSKYRKRRYGSKRSTRRYGSKRYRSKSRYGSKKYPAKARRTTLKVDRLLRDTTLVKFHDYNTFVTVEPSLPSGGAPTSYVNFYLSASDLYYAFGPYAPNSRPTGFNEWMAFYNNFLVHESFIKITPICYYQPNEATVADYSGSFELTVLPVTVNTLTTATVTFSEQPYAKTKIFNGMPTISSTGTYTLSATQNYLGSITNCVKNKKMLGYGRLSDVPALFGTSTSSPAEQVYWMVEIRANPFWLSTSSVPAADLQMPPIMLRVDLWSKAQLRDRKLIPDSGVLPEP